MIKKQVIALRGTFVVAPATLVPLVQEASLAFCSCGFTHSRLSTVLSPALAAVSIALAAVSITLAVSTTPAQGGLHTTNKLYYKRGWPLAEKFDCKYKYKEVNKRATNPKHN